MAIWMGLDGGIRIARTATEQIYANISVADVDAGIDWNKTTIPSNMMCANTNDY